MDTIARLKAEQTRLIAAEAEAARHARWLAAELDAVTNELMRLDADTRAQHRAGFQTAFEDAPLRACRRPDVCLGSKATDFGCSRDFRFSPESDQIAAPQKLTQRAMDCLAGDTVGAA
jgi:hypothetical protein